MRVDRAGRIPPNPIYADIESFIARAEAAEDKVFAQMEEDRINNNVGKKMRPAVKNKKTKKKEGGQSEDEKLDAWIEKEKSKKDEL